MNGAGLGLGLGLGLRSSSTGSLTALQQSHNAFQSQAYPALQVLSPPLINSKKLGKAAAGAYARERFGFLPICRMGRRKAGMMFLVLVSSLVLFSFFYIINKDADQFMRVEKSNHPSIVSQTYSVLTHRSTPVPSPNSGKLGTDEVYKSHQTSFSSSQNKSNIQSLVPGDFSLPPDHPCNKFTLPPPPADKKRTGPRPCPVCYLPVEKAIELMPAAPSETPVLKHLTYVTGPVSNLPINQSGGSEFGGYPTLKQREEYFNIQESMNVHCGFVKGSKPGNATGFDLDAVDLSDMEQCKGIIVASAIFGNYDEVQQPKNIGEKAKKDVCFFMFVDEETEAFLRKTAALDSSRRIGLWRVVVVHNLPYLDARRNGKIPKLLLHRLFPNARFSLWIDGKLELVVDPYQILERFLWRSHDTFAISRHYKRFDVFDEAEANKAAAKYDNASIDAQIAFYKMEGLTHYSPSKYPITSDVPEGCVIVREHTPITNLFTCVWFHEVDRFTSRDQISFAIVRDKIMSQVNWRVNMFLDCERRNFVVQAYHRDVLEQLKARRPHPPVPAKPEQLQRPLDESSKHSLSLDDKTNEKTPVRFSGRKSSSKHVRDKRSSNARHRKTRAGSRTTNTS